LSESATTYIKIDVKRLEKWYSFWLRVASFCGILFLVGAVLVVILSLAILFYQPQMAFIFQAIINISIAVTGASSIMGAILTTIIDRFLTKVLGVPKDAR